MNEPGLINSYVQLWKRYVDFGGVSNKADFWWVVLANVIISLVFNLLGQVTSVFTWIATIYELAVLIPTLALDVRRLRDAGFPWTNLFWAFLPIVGWIILVIKFCQPSVKTSLASAQAAATDSANKEESDK